MRYIEDFKEDDHIVDTYLCKQRQSLKSKAGKTYLSLKLQDKTGQIDAKVWDLNNNIQNFKENDYIKIDGDIVVYQNALQIKIKKLRCSQEGEYDKANYIPSTDKDIDSMYEQIVGYINSVSSPHIKQLLENILINNTEIVSLFKSNSAGKSFHHNYLGGLIEHTLSVVSICDFMSTKYKHINRDILVASAMLHDIGKVYELSEFPDNDYTDQGQLVGHIVIGAELITSETSNIPDFPERVQALIKHCILSHHGELQFGSPVMPKIIEAYILHCADNMDAKSKIFEDAISKDDTQGVWTGYNKMLARYVSSSDV